MDYVFGSAISLFQQLVLIIGYDIACQWYSHLLERIERDWPEELRPRGVETRPVIGKLHEPAHKRIGHDEYSCNFAPGLGLTDFECLERIWAGNNGASNATKTYGPGTRQDVLDDHFGFWNWEKYKGLGRFSLPLVNETLFTTFLSGSTLIRRYKSALKERNLQVEGHRGFTAVIPQATVQEWEWMCMAWDAAPYPKAGVVKSPFFAKNTSQALSC